MTITLHFGMQKTASTSLQRSFHAKGRWEGHAYLATGRTQSNDLVRFSKTHDLPAFRAEVARRLATPIARAGDRHVVVSSENFPFLGEDALLALVETLQATGRPVRAIGYVRRPKSFMESIFQERLKKRRMTEADLAALYPAYRLKFAKFETARTRLGLAVDYWLYEPERMTDGCVVRDFCARLAIPFAPEDVVRENVGLSLPAIRLLQTFRTHGDRRANAPRLREANRALVAALAGLKGPKFRLHSALAAPILAANAADIAWMEARLGVPLAEDLAAHDAGAVRRLDDLLVHEPEALDWLRRAAGVRDDPRRAPPEAAAPGAAGTPAAPVPPETVTAWMLRLRRAATAEAQAGAPAGRAERETAA